MGSVEKRIAGISENVNLLEGEGRAKKEVRDRRRGRGGEEVGGNLQRSRFFLVKPGSLIPALVVQGESKGQPKPPV